MTQPNRRRRALLDADSLPGQDVPCAPQLYCGFTWSQWHQVDLSGLDEGAPTTAPGDRDEQTDGVGADDHNDDEDADAWRWASDDVYHEEALATMPTQGRRSCDVAADVSAERPGMRAMTTMAVVASRQLVTGGGQPQRRRGDSDEARMPPKASGAVGPQSSEIGRSGAHRASRGMTGELSHCAPTMCDESTCAALRKWWGASCTPPQREGVTARCLSLGYRRHTVGGLQPKGAVGLAGWSVTPEDGHPCALRLSSQFRSLAQSCESRTGGGGCVEPGEMSGGAATPLDCHRRGPHGQRRAWADPQAAVAGRGHLGPGA